MNPNEILNNIALTQASIAYILHGEGEKLEKIVNNSDEVCELLNANELVIGALKTAVSLQDTIYHQLKTLLNNMHRLEHTQNPTCPPNHHPYHNQSSNGYYYCNHCMCYHPYK